jgi:hypothetical protein
MIWGHRIQVKKISMNHIRRYNESIDSLYKKISYDEFIKKLNENTLESFSSNEVSKIILELASFDIEYAQTKVNYVHNNALTHMYLCLSIGHSIIGDLFIHKTSDLYFYVEVSGLRTSSEKNDSFLHAPGSYYVVDTIDGFKNLVDFYKK